LHTSVNQTYEEANNFTNSISPIGPGEDGKWDFALYDRSLTSSSTYCIRAVKADNTPLDTYEVYPEINTPVWPTATQTAGVIEDETGADLSGYTARTGERLRVKLQLETDTGHSRNKTYRLEFDRNDSVWQTVTPSSAIRPSRSRVFSGPYIIGPGDAAACPGNLTARPGRLHENTNRTENLRVYGSACHEFGFTIDTASAATGTTYRFRLIDATASSTLNAYDAYPSFTISGSQSLKYSYALLPNLPDTADYDGLITYFDNAGYADTMADDTAYETIYNLPAMNGTSSIADADTSILTDVNNFGYRLTSGDFNADGIDDLAIGEPTLDDVYIYYGSPSMSALQTRTYPS
jgi:hypothetical protein